MWRALNAEKDEVTRAVAENDKTVWIQNHPFECKSDYSVDTLDEINSICLYDDYT